MTYCAIVSYDYLDYDVFLNVRVFYRSAGFRLASAHDSSPVQLLVILRGVPSRIDTQFRGIIHVYDYVRQYTVDYRFYFPHASKIYFITLDSEQAPGSFDKLIRGFVPVFPSLWVSHGNPQRKHTKPVHIANYKPIGNDFYQKQLIELIQTNKVTVYGSKWDHLEIHASPLSYLSANNLLSKSLVCFGLMYPYQRGSSLSGRMWQAPINGCYVISEKGTNVFECPGVLECSNFREALNLSLQDPYLLSVESIDFWLKKTKQLADELGLIQNQNVIQREILVAKLSLVSQHLSFLWSYYVQKNLDFLVLCTRKLIRPIITLLTK